MNDLTLLDGAVVLGVLLYALAGWRRGLLRAGGALAGFVVGVVLALRAAPWAAGRIAHPTVRTIVVVIVVIAILSICSGIGRRLGSLVRNAVSWRPAQAVDGLFGAALHAAMALLLVATAVFGVSTLGISSVSKAVASSPVLRAVQRNTPTPIEQLFAQLRSGSVSASLPSVSGPDLPGAVRPGASQAVASDAIRTASASVVRVSGVAAECSQSQTGSGFVVAQDRIITNAHVVSGVDDVLVEVPGREAVSGRVVYYDAAKDLAVIATEGLNATPLSIGTESSAGDTVVIAGYPKGGPLTLEPGAVQGLTRVEIDSGATATKHQLAVYSIAGNVQEGNSGGPLLNTSGEVVGTVFAKSTSKADVGYALTLDEVRPVISAAQNYTETVSDGTCVQG